MTKAKTSAPPPAVIHGIKGFDRDMKCRGVQFEVGNTYTHDGPVVPCKSGFHAIPDDQHPLAVFDFYAPGRSRFARVELSGETARDGGKIAAQILTVGKEIGFADLVRSAVDLVMMRVTATSGYASPSATSGTRSPSATSGNDSPSATSGYASPSTTSGNDSPSATSGTRSPSATSGTRSPSATSGYDSPSTTSGNDSPSATSGYDSPSEVSGKNSTAMTAGSNSPVRGADGCSLFCNEIGDSGVILSNACGIVGRDGIAAGVWYCCKDGKLVEVAQ